MERIYRLVDRNNKIIYQGSYEECSKREIDKLEYVGICTPIYQATDDNGLNVTGTMKELSMKLNIPFLTLYNYTRYKRKKDGLTIRKIGETIV